jgi:hypothetical protein
LSADFAPEDWLALPDDQKARVEAQVANLVVHGNTNLCALSKVLVLLYPQLVSLMDDAALWFALASGEEPTRADSPSASASQFVPMMNWFCHAYKLHEPALVSIAGAHKLSVLDGPQVLDRLLWQHSWGNRDRFARTSQSA